MNLTYLRDALFLALFLLAWLACGLAGMLIGGWR